MKTKPTGYCVRYSDGSRGSVIFDNREKLEEKGIRYIALYEHPSSPPPSSEWRDVAEKLATELWASHVQKEQGTDVNFITSPALSAYRALLAKDHHNG